MSLLNATGKRVVVLGGGLAGLSYAHYLRTFLAFHKKEGSISKITVLDANDYMGGSVKTKVFDDDVVHELGPRSVRLVGVKAQNTGILIEQLGLSDRVMMVTQKSGAGKNRYVYKGGKLWIVPTSLTKLFSKLPDSKTRMIGALKNDIMNRKCMDCSKYADNDPPLYDFVTYRFGKDTAECVLDPLLRGITAGDVRQTSTKALFGDMLAKEQTYGSVMKGIIKPPTTVMSHDEMFPHDVEESKLLDKFQAAGAISFNLTTGLQTLPEHLSNSLLNTNDDDVLAIYNRTKVKEIQFNTTQSDAAPCSVSVETVDGDQVMLEADHIVSSLPAKNLAEVLPANLAAEHKRALKYVREIPHAPVGCVVLEYRGLGKKLPPAFNSFGFLTHSEAGSKVLGIAFDTAMFPSIDKPYDSFRMTAMLGGHWYKEIFGTEDLDKVTDAQMEQVALEEINKILGLSSDPYRATSYLWKTGIAQYRPGHIGMVRETREKIAKTKMPLTILGQSYDGVAVNDVIYSARIAANDFVKAL